jgi:hypothetical protein
MIQGCGPEFEAHFDEALLDLLARAVQHPSRFVREAAFHVMTSLVIVCTHSQRRCVVTNSGRGGLSTLEKHDREETEECYEMDFEVEEVAADPSVTAAPMAWSSPLERFSVPLCQLLASGLADSTENWAQVR